MIRQAKSQMLPFEIVGCDSFYGRDSTFRANLANLGLMYIADVPADTEVYLSEPVTGIPKKRCGKQGSSIPLHRPRGRPPKRVRVLNGVEAISVCMLAKKMAKKPISVRQTERGLLVYACASRLVWTITKDGKVHKEWLFVRQEPDSSDSFSLSNAPSDTPIQQLVFFRCQRYFVERTFQDAKTEAGWDELVARKYRAFLHHTALNALALWFAAETKLDWAAQYPPDTSLATQLEVEQLPALSIANIRELLKAVLPLKQLSPEQARQLVVKHLVDRSHSIRCRLKTQRRQQSGPSP